MRRQFNKGFKGRKPTMKWNNENIEYGFQGVPKTEGEVKDHISVVAMKDLPKSSYSIKADPYSAMLPGSEPYALLNRFNPRIDGSFTGEDNIDGGNVQQYANSYVSKFLDYFDFFRTKVMLRYRYLPISKIDAGYDFQTANYKGKALIDEMRKSISEAVSVLTATTFTNLQINNFAVVTEDMFMGSAITKNIAKEGEEPIMAYTNLTDVLYAMSIYYQVFLQNVNSVFKTHDSFRMKQGTMLRSAWNREVPYLNSFFGLMNKKSFLSLINSIALSFQGEFFDKDFADQISDMCFIPSRRSNSITDPVLELQATFAHPHDFKVVVLDEYGQYAGKTFEKSVLFDDAMLTTQVAIGGQVKTVSLWEACDALRDYLSCEQIMLWARSDYKAGGIINSENARYNDIKSYFDVVVNSFTTFKPRWSDYRACLDTMLRTGTVNWTKEYKPEVTNNTDMTLFENMIVHNIYNELMGGSPELHYNSKTKRWTSYAKWNIYNGIPQYDMKQGGFFIAAASKDIRGDDDFEQIPYLPIAYDRWTAKKGETIYTAAAVNRRGTEVLISISDEVIDHNRILTRLCPLPSQNDLKIRLPYVKVDEGNLISDNEISSLYKTLTQLFDVCKIEKAYNGENYIEYSIDPDLLAVYQIEYADITNVAITYARANAPFKGTTSEQGILGFFGFSKK